MDSATGPPGSTGGVALVVAVKALELDSVSGTAMQPAVLVAPFAVAAVVLFV